MNESATTLDLNRAAAISDQFSQLEGQRLPPAGIERNRYIADLEVLRQSVAADGATPGHYDDMLRYRRRIADDLEALFVEYDELWAQTKGLVSQDVLNDGEVERLAQQHDELSQRLLEVLRLWPEEEKSARYQQSDTFRASARRRIDRSRALLEARRRAQKIWADQTDLERTSPIRFLNRLGGSLEEIRNLRQNDTWQWSPDEIDHLYALEGEAQIRYDAARQRYEIPLTKVEGGAIVEGFILLRQQAQTSPKSQVVYFKTAEQGSDQGPMPVENALMVARTFLLRFWQTKVREYVANAQALLAEYKPREALTALRKWQELSGLHDERVNLSLPETERKIVETLTAKINEDLQKLQEAESLATKAENVARHDPVKAHQLWDQANQAYARMSGLSELGEAIREYAGNEMAQLVDRLEDDVSQERWRAARSGLERGQQLLDISSRADETYGSRFVQLKAVYEDVQIALAQEQGLEAQQMKLEALRSKYAGRWADWKGLRGRLEELQTRSSVQGLLDTINQICHPDAAPLEMLQIQQDAQQKQGALPADWPQREKMALDKGLEKLTAWIGFSQARDEARKINITDEEGMDPALIVAPDLAVWQNGLDAARQETGALQAARKLRLDTLLNQLEKADEQIKPEIERIKGQLIDADQDALRQYLITVNERLTKPSSYRTELIQIRRETERQLVESINAQIARNLQKSAPLYLQLDFRETERLRSESQKLSQSIRIWRSDWQPTFDPEQARGPIAAADAHEKEMLAQDKKGSWSAAQTAWREAISLIEERDVNLKNYARQRERKAHKEVVFRQVRNGGHDNPVSSERLLYSLCEDPLLSSDWQVWQEHGRFCLQWVILTIKDDSATAPVEWRARLQKARVSLNRAIENLKSDHEMVTKTDSVADEIRTISEWETVVDLKTAVQKLLQPDEARRLTSRDCQAAVARLSESATRLKLEQTRQYARHFWQRQQQTARRLLENQLEDEESKKDVFGQIDTLVALLALVPQNDLLAGTTTSISSDESAKKRLNSVIFQAADALQSIVQSLAKDYAAANFRADFYHSNPEEELLDQEVARRQLERARSIQITQFHPLLAAIRLNGLTDDVDLSDEETRLDAWIEELQKLVFSLGQALNLAQDGLQDPEQFEKARFILRRGGADRNDLPQVPLNFRDRSHPTYRWHEAEIAALQQQRERQERFKERISALLTQEQKISRQVLAIRHGVLKSQEDDENIRVLPELIEQALLTIQEMLSDDPEDTTGLQETITYEMVESNGRLFRSLHVINSVLQAKKEQWRNIQEWFDRFHAEPIDENENDRIVSWQREKAKLVHLRNLGPKELIEARNRSRRILGSDGERVYEGQHALQPALALTSWEAMVTYLKRLSNTPEQTIIVYASSEKVNQQRISLQQSLQVDIEDCIAFETDLTRRINHYNDAFDALTDAYNRISTIRKWPWQRWQNTPAWHSFTIAVSRFCQICPEYPEFKGMIQEVGKRTGLYATCLAKDIAS